MNQARISVLISKLNYNIQPKARKLKNVDGPEGRIFKLKKSLTALLKYERIELNYNRADEARGYIDLLISQAMQYGPDNKKTMELANFWILEKQFVYKLFNVLVPRYKSIDIPFTVIHSSPRNYPGINRKRAILELKGNPFPDIPQHFCDGQMLIQNALLNEARKQYHIQQHEGVLNKINSQ